MLILVTLPPWPKRMTPGTLKLYTGADTLGTMLYSCPCLGMSDHYMAAKHGNPTGNPLLPFGDTPTGGYACTYSAILGDAQFLHSYGPNGIISMVGQEGQALAAYQGIGWPGSPDYKPARVGIDIHGGDPIPGTAVGLRVTDGCIRVANPSMATIASYLRAGIEPIRCIVGEIAGSK